MTIYSRWNTEGAPRPRLSSALPSLAQQQFAKEADVNVLIERYKKTGSFYNPLTPSSFPRMPQYADISEIPDMMGQMELLDGVQRLFASLPARVREQFGHSVAEFVAWAQNPANFEAGVKMGIFDPAISVKPPEAAKEEGEGAAQAAASSEKSPAQAGQSAQPLT